MLLKILLLTALFYGISKSADLVVKNTKLIGKTLNLSSFFLGIILGLLTSLPEFAIGLNSILAESTPLAVGNLLGSIIVLGGLVLGINAVINKKIHTNGNLEYIIIYGIYICIPVLLALDGKFSTSDGIILILGYFATIYLTAKREHGFLSTLKLIHPRQVQKEMVFTIIGVVGIIVLAKLIIDISTGIIDSFNLNKFVTGLLLFSIGTNLPEILISFKANKHSDHDLSISNIVGSGIANIFILGIISAINPLTLSSVNSLLSAYAFIAILLILIAIFYKSKGHFSRHEGFVLLTVYIIFILFEGRFLL